MTAKIGTSTTGRKTIIQGDIILRESLPEWAPQCFEESRNAAPNIVWTHNGHYWFDGLIFRLFERAIIPNHIHIIFDMNTVSCATRLVFGDERQPRMIIDAPFEIESFAMLWNTKPTIISGYPGNMITMHLNPDDGVIPTLLALDIAGFLAYRSGMFHVAMRTEDLMAAIETNRVHLEGSLPA